MPAEARWPAMGSDVHVVVVGDERLLAVARRQVAELEARWSRFRPDSEVSRLNAADGRPVVVSPVTRRLLERAVAGWRITDGLFDPTVLGDVVRAGYDRSFEAIGTQADVDRRDASRAAQARRGAAGIVISSVGVVCLPSGVGIDPGGVGKGLAADMVAAELVAAGARGCCVNVGGDVRVRGQSPEGGAWRIDVEDPRDGRVLAHVGLGEGAVATSSTRRRRWQVDGEERHHLIDPRTGLPARTTAAAVTVVARRAWQAEVLTKAALIGGDEGVALVERNGAAALVVDDDGTVTTTSTWAAFTAGYAWSMA